MDRSIIRGIFWWTTQRLGIANTNGGTGSDTTSLIEIVPVSQLDAVLWLESDRMGYLLPALNQKTLSEQIEIIRNEINMNRMSRGKGALPYCGRRLSARPSYHGVAVGDPQELGNITLDDVRNFFKSYYAPSNAAVVIAGDITPSEALEKVKRYFGGLPTSPRPGRVTAWIPELSQDKRECIFDTAPPQLFLVWPMPSFGTTDDVYLRLAGSILMDGASIPGAGGAFPLPGSTRRTCPGVPMPGAWQVFSRFRPKRHLQRSSGIIERLIRDEIAALAAKGPTGEELERAKRSRILELRRLAQRTADFNGQSELLATTWALSNGNAGLLDANMQQMRAATPADVSAATRRWLNRAAYILDLEPTVQYGPTSADVDRSHIPGATASSPPLFQETHVTTLPNGLKMRHAQWHGGPLAVAR